MAETRIDDSGVTFSFGRNWQAFNKTVTEAQIADAVEDLRKWFPQDRIKGCTVVDVGCGSGLSSLAFHLLGAGRIVSFDRDAGCVQATREHWTSAGSPADWSLLQGSARDREFLAGLGRFDIVYSWGVLQHTGAMWESIGDVASLVADGGAFLIGIYAKGPNYPKHLAMKQAYNKASFFGKKLMVARAIERKMWKRLKRMENPFAWNEKKARGMSTYHDILDWLGGLPYEVASEEEMVAFLGSRGFEHERSQIKPEGGVSVYLFQRAA